MTQLDTIVEQTPVDKRFPERFKDKVTKYATNIGQKAKKMAAIGTVLAAGIIGGQKADGATINPINDYMTTNYELANFVPMPGLTGLDDFDNYTRIGVVDGDGNFNLFSVDSLVNSTTPTALSSKTVIPNATGVTNKWDGTMGVSDAGSIFTYDVQTGQFLGVQNTEGGLTDIDFAQAYNKMTGSRPGESGFVDANGLVGELTSGNYGAIMFVDMEPGTYDMFFGKNNTWAFNEDGTALQNESNSYFTNLGAGGIPSGMGVGRDSSGQGYVFMSFPEGIVAYRDIEGGFTEHLNEIPEPATIALMGLGGLALMRRRRNNSLSLDTSGKDPLDGIDMSVPLGEMYKENTE